MDRELLRNDSGYVDMTAYTALMNMKGDLKKMEFKRGDIVEFEKASGGTNLSLIVSADERAREAYLSHLLLVDNCQSIGNFVPICCRGGVKYANCNMVTYGKAENFVGYQRTASESEMRQIDAALIKALGIEPKVIERTVEIEKENPATGNLEELASARAEAKVYKDLYDKLLQQVMNGR